MRFVKRLFRILFLVLILGGIGLVVLHRLSKSRPARYMPNALTDQQRDAAAWRLEHQKLPTLMNLVERSQKMDSAAQRAKAKGLPVPPDATQPVAPITLSFTQDEINSFLWKWSQQYKSTYEHYITNPYVSVEDGSIVLMGTVPEFDRVVSAFFEPRLDDKGMLHSDLASVKMGSLPLPEALFSSKRDKVEKALKTRLPNWQNHARIDPTGLANSDAQSAWLGKLVLQLLDHQPSPAVVFVHTENSTTVPVRLTNVTVEKGALTITVQPMSAQERADLLDQIRTPQQSSTASSTDTLSATASLPRN